VDIRGVSLLANYGTIGLFSIVAVLFALVMVILPILLRFIKIVPNRPNDTKASIFECGVETIGKTWVQFNFHYYFYALIFLALDVLVVFLYPWAVQLRALGVSSLVTVLVLVGIILVGYFYAWKKKVLEWK
jgi:NADH-quinone oxidoreductase subunit A